MSADIALLRKAAEHLAAAERPLLLLGPESATALPALLALADHLGAAVLTTPDAKSRVDEHRSSGIFSFGAPPAARALAAEADCVLAVSALGEFTCRLGEAFRGRVVLQVTDRAQNVGRSLTPEVALVGSIDIVARALLGIVTAAPARERWDLPIARALRPLPPPPARPGVIHPAAAIDAIQVALPERARVCLDITTGALHAGERWLLSTEQRVFSSIEQSACMGEALLASIGVRLASNCSTLALVGDWGYCMTPQELHTAVELELDRYVIVIWANGGGALVKAGVERQGFAVPDAAFRWRFRPHFAEVARAYGASTVIATDAGTLAAAVAAGLSADRTTVVEARIDPDADVPAGDRFAALDEAKHRRQQVVSR